MQYCTPVFALAAPTFAAGFRLIYLRVAVVRRGELSPRYYRLNRGSELPDYLAKVNNNYNNLLELPILFYVVCVLLMVTARVDAVQLVLAWAYVATRCIHSLIHITFNRLRYRAWVFFFNVAALVAMWIRLVTQTMLA